MLHRLFFDGQLVHDFFDAAYFLRDFDSTIDLGLIIHESTQHDLAFIGLYGDIQSLDVAIGQ